MLPLLRAFKKAFAQKQRTNNPFDPKTEAAKYSEYEAGWYTGYVIGEVAKIAASAGGSFALKGAVKGSTLATKLDEVLTEGSRAYRAAKELKRTKEAVETQATVAVLRGVGEAGSGVVRGARTVGTKIKVARLQRQADVDTSDLSTSQQDFLRRYLQLGGDSAARRLSRKSDDEVEDFTLGGVCPRAGAGAATAQAALRAGTDCELTDFDGVDDDLDKEFAEAFHYYDLAESGLDGADFKRYLNNLSPEQRQTVLRFASNEYKGRSGADIVVRSWKAYKFSDEVPGTVKLINDINYLKEEGVEIESGTYRRLTNPKLKTYKGGSYEIELANEIMRGETSVYDKYGEVVAVGREIGDSDGDIWLQTDSSGKAKVVVEAKNFNFDGTYQGDSIFLIESKLKRKLNAYKNSDTDVDIMYLSYRVDSVPENVRDVVEKLEEEYGIKIIIREDQDLVEQ